jgi:hypothetical protein
MKGPPSRPTPPPGPRWAFLVGLLIFGPGLTHLIAGEPWSFCPVALAADPPRSDGVDLGVTVLRSGDDPRLVVSPGQKLTLSVGVNNLRGRAEAHSSVLGVTLPSAVGLVAARAAPDRSERQGGAQVLTWNLGTIRAGAFPRLFEIDVAVRDDIAPGTDFTVSANVAGGDPETNTANNAGSLTFHVQRAAAALILRSGLDGVPFTGREPVRFTVEVANLGTVRAASSTLALVLPAGVSLDDSDPAASPAGDRSLLWKLGDIPAGASRTVRIALGLGTSQLGEVLTFALDASTQTPGADPSGSHLEIARRVDLADADLRIWLAVEGANAPGELPVGKDIAYVIRYGNFGNKPASGVMVTLGLDQGLDFLRSEPPPHAREKSDRFGGGVLSWEAGTLRVGDWRTINSHVHVTAASEEGSLVLATIAAPDDSSHVVARNSATSHRHAAKPPAPTGGSSYALWLLALLVAGGFASAVFFWRWRR